MEDEIEFESKKLDSPCIERKIKLIIKLETINYFQNNYTKRNITSIIRLYFKG